MTPEVTIHAELMIAAVAISVLGLPHGALDPWIAWRAKIFETPLGLLSFLAGYIALCLIGLGVWSIAPSPRASRDRPTTPRRASPPRFLLCPSDGW